MQYTYTKATVPKELEAETGLSQVALSILFKRGFKTQEEINSILYHDYTQVLNRLDFKDADIAALRIIKAIKNGEKIVIYSDYDCDGACSGSLAVETITAIRGNVSHYANQRDVDGYGLCINGINNILKMWPDVKLIITVDNGILAFNGVAHAKSLGLDVIVTDHHEADEELPDAIAIINPKRKDETYPMREICGTTVIFKLMLNVYKRLKYNPQPVLNTIDLVATATISDVMPLIGENRAIVREGLKVMAEGRRGFFKAYLSNNFAGCITADTLGYQIGPMINAVSRMCADISIAYGALLAKTEAEAMPFFKQLQQLNEQRKSITKDFKESVFCEAQSMIDKNKDLNSIVIFDPTIPSGIVGIIAGDICNRLQRPTIILTKEQNSQAIKGSSRSCGEFNLKDSLDLISDGILLGYGGHAMAAGLSMDEHKLDNFKIEFEELAKASFESSEVNRGIEIDVVVDEKECTEEFIRSFQLLEPFGEGFSAPIFGLTAKIISETTLGKENQHLKYTSESGIQILKWNYTTKPSIFPSKFIGSPNLNSFRGNVSVQFIDNY